MTTKTFKDLGLSEEILQVIAEKGFTSPTPIQAGVIPLLLNGTKDIIGQAQTGTGKTAAFALPILEKLDSSIRRTQAIILVPTRELAIQVSKELKSFQVKNSPTVALVYGGNPIRDEIAVLNRQPNIVIGTPGRMQHHIRNRNLVLDDVKYFVLDEADEMLSFGFRDEIEEILKLTPPQRRVLLFSATMPQSIMRIVNNYMGNHEIVKTEVGEKTNKNITQKYYCVKNQDKFEALCRIMEDEETFYAIVFCRTKSETDFVASQLVAKHLRAEAIHGDIDQNQREKVLSRFRANQTNILVATDVAARGIDISELNFVVNYSLPENHEVYTHRIGRTGRAGNLGIAITLITKSELYKLRYFEKDLGISIEKGNLPNPKDIVIKKQEHLIARLEHIINNENIEYLLPLAKQLLEEADPAKTIAALLRDSYKNDFDVNSYKSVEDDASFGGSSERRYSKPSSGGRGGRGYGSRNGGGFGGGSGGYRKSFSSDRDRKPRSDFGEKKTGFFKENSEKRSDTSYSSYKSDRPESGGSSRPPFRGGTGKPSFGNKGGFSGGGKPFGGGRSFNKRGK